MASGSEYFQIVCDAAKTAGVDEDLACAIASIESSWSPWAARYEPTWSYLVNPDDFAVAIGISRQTEVQFQKVSWGLMQVMGSVAREFGFKGPLQQLCAPMFGCQYACAKLAKLVNKYQNEADAVAAYNAGSPQRDASGRYVNYDYVRKVSAKLAELRQIKKSS